jgi:hypothetical protein
MKELNRKQKLAEYLEGFKAKCAEFGIAASTAFVDMILKHAQTPTNPGAQVPPNPGAQMPLNQKAHMDALRKQTAAKLNAEQAKNAPNYKAPVAGTTEAWDEYDAFDKNVQNKYRTGEMDTGAVVGAYAHGAYQDTLNKLVRPVGSFFSHAFGGRTTYKPVDLGKMYTGEAGDVVAEGAGDFKPDTISPLTQEQIQKNQAGADAVLGRGTSDWGGYDAGRGALWR